MSATSSAVCSVSSQPNQKSRSRSAPQIWPALIRCALTTMPDCCAWRKILVSQPPTVTRRPAGPGIPPRCLPRAAGPRPRPAAGALPVRFPRPACWPGSRPPWRSSRPPPGPSPGPRHPLQAQRNFRKSSASMPMFARMFRKEPFAMSRPRVDRSDDRPAIGVTHHAMTPADSHDRETSPFKRPDHLHPRNGREGLGHQATSRVSVSSSGGPTSASNASSAPRRSATAASTVGPSPTAPTPGRSCAGRSRRRLHPVLRRKAHGLRGSLPTLPHQERSTDHRVGRTRPAA